MLVYILAIFHFFNVPEVEDVTAIITNFHMTTVRKGRRYLATVARGQTITLQGHKSNVQLQINAGCPKRPHLMEVRTDLSNFGSTIPDDECFISPIVKVLAPAETSTSSYILRIPHCLDEEADRSKVRVRMIHENKKPAVIEVPKGNTGALFYDIDSNFIELHTTHFTTITCTICQTPFHCLETVNSFLFAKFNTQKRNMAEERKDSDTPWTQIHSQHDVVIRPYFCGIVQGLSDFREVIPNYLK